MKAAWDRVVLRVAFWHAPIPDAGDEIETRTGRRYQIIGVRQRGAKVTALECLVLPRDATVQGRVFYWEWNRR